MLAATAREAGRRFGDLVAFVDPDGCPLTYRDLDRLSDAVAAGLVRRGVGAAAGDRVVLRLPSDAGYVLAYVAAAKVGAVTAGINPRLALPEQDALVELADPAIVLGDPAEVDGLRQAGWDDPAPRALPADPQRPVAIVFTSGTTGRPRGAAFAEAQLAAIAQVDTGGTWAAEPGPAMLASTQFAHVGFMTKLAWYLQRATRTHVLGRWRAENALRTVAEQQMPSIGGVAPQVALMLRSPEVDRHDWAHVRTLVMGGAASPPTLVAEARERFGAAYSIRYSSTESGGCGTGTAFDADDAEALHTVGRPRPGIAVEIRADDGRTLASTASLAGTQRGGRPGSGGQTGQPSNAPHADGDNEVGELWLRSPTQMSGYWRDPEATAATLVDGWLRTGDLARLDERGNVVLAGRRTDMFIRGGYNVHPAEVEAALLAHPQVADVAVVPTTDPVMGEVGVAVVVPADPDVPPDLDQVREFLAPRLASYKLPEALRIVDALPLTPMQKLDRRALMADEA
ncbi:MAG: class I adenylate-forming enzyme family protein [Acidimicrobiales bacterium]